MNKKTLIGTGLAILAGAGLAIYLRKQYKKVSAEVEEEEKNSDKELKEQGVSPEKVEEECREDSGNMVKALAAGTMFNPKWDMDIIDPGLALDADCLISVTQEDNNLVFIFDIPNYTNGGFKSPKLKDYIMSIKNKTLSLWEEYAKFSPRPRFKLVGTLNVSYQIDGEEISERVEIDDPTIYEEFADEHHDGLGTFFELVCKKKLPETVSVKFQTWVDTKWGYLTEKNINVRAINVGLVYKVKFAIQNHSGIGVSLNNALNILDKYVNDMSVQNKHSDEVTYDNVLFCAPNSKGEFDMTWFYVANDGKLEIDNYTFE